MKKILLFFIVLLTAIFVIGCENNNENPKPETTHFTVTFDSMGGSNVSKQSIEEGKFALEPDFPEKDGFIFLYWYLENEDEEFLFEVNLIDKNITLKALWKVLPPDVTPEQLIEEDILAIKEQLVISKHQIYLPTRGPVNNSVIAWTTSSEYVTKSGILLPIPEGEINKTEIRGRFSLGGKVVNRYFDVELHFLEPVEIKEERTVPFRNLTTEYDVADVDIKLLYEENSTVPYISIVDFLDLLEGFIDPSYEITYSLEGSIFTAEYDYLDEDINEDYLLGLSDFDGWYNLTLVIDTEENTITTPDPGFYFGYIYSTETNYGRHIKYDRNNEDSYFSDGDDLTYNLSDYNMDIVIYDGEVVLPYYIANQLFAGSSYYNVYYNYDGLYGIYALPSYGSDEYKTIRNSSVNNTLMEADLIIHNFDFLAFALNEFYGAKDLLDFDNFYELLHENKNNLLDPNVVNFDNTLFNIIMKDIDEPHTSYGYPGYYNVADYIGPRLTSLDQMGPRVNSFYVDGLYAVDDAIIDKWNLNPTSWAADDPDRPIYWFLDKAKKSVVLSLDGFNTSDIEELDVYNDLFNKPFKNDNLNLIPSIVNGNKYFYYNNSTKEKNIGNILVKGLTTVDFNNYVDELENFGYIYDDVLKYYIKQINGKNYHLYIDYDNEFNLLYIGIIELDLEEEIDDYFDDISYEIKDFLLEDSAVYMEIYMERIIKESPGLKNILLDLSFNTGGNVGALYRVLGFVTNKSFRVSSISPDTNSYSTSFVYIDGVPTYENLNWGIIQSPATFSAANSMATIFKENELGVVIGTKSGGGASSITPILLPNGTAFTMSSNNVSAYAVKTGNEDIPYEYFSNELGIDPDYELIVENLYNESMLFNIIELYLSQKNPA